MLDPADEAPFADCEKYPVTALCNEAFMLLEKGTKAEASEIFVRFSAFSNVANVLE